MYYLAILLIRKLSITLHLRKYEKISRTTRQNSQDCFYSNTQLESFIAFPFFLINIKYLLPSMFSSYRPIDLYFLLPLIKERNHYRSMRQGVVGSNAVTAEIHYSLSFREFHQWQDLKQYRVIPSISLQKHLSVCKQDDICTISKGAINHFFFFFSLQQNDTKIAHLQT